MEVKQIFKMAESLIPQEKGLEEDFEGFMPKSTMKPVVEKEL